MLIESITAVLYYGPAVIQTLPSYYFFFTLSLVSHLLLSPSLLSLPSPAATSSPPPSLLRHSSPLPPPLPSPATVRAGTHNHGNGRRRRGAMARAEWLSGIMYFYFFKNGITALMTQISLPILIQWIFEPAVMVFLTRQC